MKNVITVSKKIKYSTKVVWILFSYYIFNCFATEIPLFWEKEISAAIESREKFFQKNSINKLPVPYNQEKLIGYIPKPDSIAEDSLGIWSNLIRGLLASGHAAEQHFASAVWRAKNEPGHLWLLFSEFRRNKIYNWADSALIQLQRHMYASGAQIAPIIAQQLIFSSQSHSKTNESQSDYYYRAANKFCPFFPNPPTTFFSKYLFNLSLVTKIFPEVLSITLGHWYLQIVFLYYVRQWLKLLALFFICACVGLLAGRYIPRIVHPVAELFPKSISQKLRQLLSLLMFFSFISFGLVPFIWLVVFLIWRYLKLKEKLLLGGCILTITLSPLLCSFDSALNQIALKNSPLYLYHNSSNAGYIKELEETITETLANEKKNYLLNVAAALSAAKAKDFQRALRLINTAEHLKPADPVVLTAKGNILFWLDSLLEAKHYYLRCLQFNSTYYAAVFNLGHCMLKLRETAEGLKYLSQATKMNHDVVAQFIRINDLLFTDSLPVLRKVIQPDYSTVYFWKKVFPFVSLHASKDAVAIWGTTFFGIPPLISFLLFILFSLILIVSDFLLWQPRNVKRFDTCTLCGRPICRICKKGLICCYCFELTHDFHHPEIQQRIRNKIVARKKTLEYYYATIFDIIYPGVGMAYLNHPFSWYSLFFICCTSALYATYGIFIKFAFSWPFEYITSVLIPLVILGLCYHIVFLVRGLHRIYLQTKKE